MNIEEEIKKKKKEIDTYTQELREHYERREKERKKRGCTPFCICGHCDKDIQSTFPLRKKIRETQKELHQLCLEDGDVSFASRGIGNDWVECFVCGGKRDVPSGVNHNISGFVNSKQDGERIRAWFREKAWLDYRKREPNWIQLKIGACDNHLANLEKLESLTVLSSTINSDMIEKALNLSTADYQEYIVKKCKQIKDTVIQWITSDYCGYKIPMKDTLSGYTNQVKIAVGNLGDYNIENIQTVYEQSTSFPMEKICDTLVRVAEQKDPQEILLWLEIVVKSIYERKLDTEADRELWKELKCDCDHPKLVTTKTYGDKIDVVDCENCGKHFWYHGTWQERTVNGWKILWDWRKRAEAQEC